MAKCKITLLITRKCVVHAQDLYPLPGSAAHLLTQGELEGFNTLLLCSCCPKEIVLDVGIKIPTLRREN